MSSRMLMAGVHTASPQYLSAQQVKGRETDRGTREQGQIKRGGYQAAAFSSAGWAGGQDTCRCSVVVLLLSAGHQ
jgi:hypothetical protein